MTLILPALAFELVTAEEMTRRRIRFRATNGPDYKGPVIVAEGDSWFCYPRDSIWVPDDAPLDLVAQLSNHFAVLALGKPGDTAWSMADFFEPFVTMELQTWKADVLLISAGGNDLLGEGKLALFLRDGNRPVSQYLKPEFYAALEDVIARIERMVRAAIAAKPGLRVMLHGYDFARPSGAGPWLKAPMVKLGIPVAKRQAIINRIVNAFYSRLAELTDTLDHELAGNRDEIELLDFRGLAGNDWYNEIHPNDAGFARITAAVRARINAHFPAVPVA